MKTLAGWGIQIGLLLAGAALAAALLACVATLTAPLHSPGYASRIFCPPGSQMESEWYQATYNKPGQRSLSVTCVDAEGQVIPARPRNETTLLAGIQLYLPVCFAPVAGLGLLILLAVNGLAAWLRRKKAPPG